MRKLTVAFVGLLLSAGARAQTWIPEGGIGATLDALKAEAARMAAPPSGAGGVDFAEALGAYALEGGSPSCAKKLSVGVVPDGVRVWSPDEIENADDPRAALRRHGGERLFTRINAPADERRTAFAVQPVIGRRLGSVSKITTTAERNRDGIALKKSSDYKDNFASGWTKTTVEFKDERMDIRFRDKDHGAPLEMGFWESLGLKGKKLELNTDCRYARVGVEPWADAPVVWDRYRVQIPGRLCASACILAQPAVFTAEFEMERVKNVNHERPIRGFKYALELAAGGSLPEHHAYVVTAAAPEKGGYYSKEGFRDSSLQFFIEAPADIGADAKGTVLEYSAPRAGETRIARFNLLPYCGADRSSCKLGILAGINSDPGATRLAPEYRFLSDATFPIEPQPTP